MRAICQHYSSSHQGNAVCCIDNLVTAIWWGKQQISVLPEPALLSCFRFCFFLQLYHLSLHTRWIWVRYFLLKRASGLRCQVSVWWFFFLNFHLFDFCIVLDWEAILSLISLSTFALSPISRRYEDTLYRLVAKCVSTLRALIFCDSEGQGSRSQNSLTQLMILQRSAACCCWSSWSCCSFSTSWFHVSWFSWANGKGGLYSSENLLSSFNDGRRRPKRNQRRSGRPKRSKSSLSCQRRPLLQLFWKRLRWSA